jgi:hypothetical protein
MLGLIVVDISFQGRRRRWDGWERCTIDRSGRTGAEKINDD